MLMPNMNDQPRGGIDSFRNPNYTYRDDAVVAPHGLTPSKLGSYLWSRELRNDPAWDVHLGEVGGQLGIVYWAEIEPLSAWLYPIRHKRLRQQVQDLFYRRYVDAKCGQKLMPRIQDRTIARDKG